MDTTTNDNDIPLYESFALDEQDKREYNDYFTDIEKAKDKPIFCKIDMFVFKTYGERFYMNICIKLEEKKELKTMKEFHTFLLNNFNGKVFRQLFPLKDEKEKYEIFFEQPFIMLNTPTSRTTIFVNVNLVKRSKELKEDALYVKSQN